MDFHERSSQGVEIWCAMLIYLKTLQVNFHVIGKEVQESFQARAREDIWGWTDLSGQGADGQIGLLVKQFGRLLG